MELDALAGRLDAVVAVLSKVTQATLDDGDSDENGYEGEFSEQYRKHQRKH